VLLRDDVERCVGAAIAPVAAALHHLKKKHSPKVASAKLSPSG
jgi:hypothetical protein